MLTTLLSAKAAAAAAVAAVTLGGAAAAASVGALPAPAQQFAHNTFGAPSPTASHSSGSGQQATPNGPDATGPAAFGLCTAYAHAKAHGSATQKAVAFRNLAAAAGGARDVASFCSTVSHPGSSASARPASLPSQAQASAAPSPSHPTGKPASHPTGKPSSLPTAPTQH